MSKLSEIDCPCVNAKLSTYSNIVYFRKPFPKTGAQDLILQSRVYFFTVIKCEVSPRYKLLIGHMLQIPLNIKLRANFRDVRHVMPSIGFSVELLFYVCRYKQIKQLL